VTEQQREPEAPDQPEVTGGSVKIWLNHKGERLFAVAVDVGTSFYKIDDAVTIAIAAARRLEQER
jgi:hypothetical protein